MNIKREIELIISEILGKAISVEDDANLMYDYNMDSLQVMNTIVCIENRFDIEFELDDLNIENLIIFSKIVECVKHIMKKDVYQ